MILGSSKAAVLKLTGVSHRARVLLLKEIMSSDSDEAEHTEKHV